MKDNRYQFQPWHVKVWRRLICSPSLAWSFARFLAWWISTGMKSFRDDKPNTKWDSIATMWSMSLSRFHHKIGWWYTLEEAFGQPKRAEE